MYENMFVIRKIISDGEDGSMQNKTKALKRLSKKL